MVGSGDLLLDGDGDYATTPDAVRPSDAGFPVIDELLARLSPLQYGHINFLGRYAFTRPSAPGLRQLRDPHSDDETDDGEDG
jgi:hypothetical protein